jgi:hypothetical protein
MSLRLILCLKIYLQKFVLNLITWKISGLIIKQEVYTPWSIIPNGKPRREAPIIQEEEQYSLQDHII